MTKKDYEKAAEIAREYNKVEYLGASTNALHSCVVEAFVALFRGDNPRFDAILFRKACESKKSRK